jgi:hypothetical protein
MSATTLAFPKNDSEQLYLPDIAANPQPGVYKDLIDAARSRDRPYSRTWDLFAFREWFTVHLARFCTQAHAAAASDALFNFYDGRITATGVPEMSAEAHRLQGENIARRGYIRDEKK